MTEEKFPVHKAVEVLYGRTIFKTDRWWMAILKVKVKGRPSFGLYFWIFDDEYWHRKQKITILDKDTWELIKKAVDRAFEESAKK